MGPAFFLSSGKEGLPCTALGTCPEVPPETTLHLRPAVWTGGAGQGKQHPPLRVSPRSQGVGREGVSHGQPCNLGRVPSAVSHRVEVRGPGPQSGEVSRELL